MKIGAIVDGVTIPEKVRQIKPQYPFDLVSEGQGFAVAPDAAKNETLATVKKRVSGAARQYERKCGKDETGAKLKEIVVWEAKNSVMVACRVDNTEAGLAFKVAKKKADRKAARAIRTKTDKNVGAVDGQSVPASAPASVPAKDPAAKPAKPGRASGKAPLKPTSLVPKG